MEEPSAGIELETLAKKLPNVEDPDKKMIKIANTKEVL